MSPAEILDLSLPYQEAKEQFEWVYFHRLLKKHKWNISKVGIEAEYSRQQLYTKLKKLGLVKQTPPNRK